MSKLIFIAICIIGSVLAADGDACTPAVNGMVIIGGACVACNTVTTGTCPTICVTAATGGFTDNTGCKCTSPKTVTSNVCTAPVDGSACSPAVNGMVIIGGTCVACNTVTTGTCPTICVTAATGGFIDNTGCKCTSPNVVTNYVCGAVIFTDGSACKTAANGMYQSGTASDNCVACSSKTTGACPAVCTAATTGNFTNGTTTGCTCASPNTVTSNVCTASTNAKTIVFGVLLVLFNLLI